MTRKWIALTVCGLVVLAALQFSRQRSEAQRPAGEQPSLHWVLDKSSVAGNVATDKASAVQARINGESTVGEQGLEIHSLAGGVLAWDRKGVRADLLPQEKFTVAGWIRVDRPTRQGGLVCLLNGRADFRKGLFVGFTHRHFNFGLSTSDVDDGYGKFTVIQSKTAYTPGRWHHLAATYDGSLMCLYVNGELAASSRTQSGRVKGPGAPLWLGRYRDNETDAPLDGALGEVAIYKDCLAAEAIRKQFQEKKHLAEMPAADIGPAFVVEPYLQFPTQDSLSILWETSTPGSTLVRYGTRTPPGEKVEKTESATAHEIALKGLKPATTYFYQTETTDASGRKLISPILTGMTSVGPEAAFSFAVIGDTQKNPKITGKLAKMMWDRRPNFVIHLGDVVDSGPDKTQWVEELFQPSAELFARVAIMPCIGNHEKDHANFYRYFALPAPKYHYRYSYGNADFFVLDTNRTVRPGSEQYQWLDQVLGESKAKWKFVYHHHPVYSSDDDDFGNTWQGSSTLGELKYRPLAALYEKHHVDVAFNGHIHLYERTWPVKENKVERDGGVVYITSGGGGGGLENFGPTPAFFKAELRVDHHYCYATIQGGQFQFKAFDQNGMLFDSFELRK
jgi:predicted phosphodiesterase